MPGQRQGRKPLYKQHRSAEIFELKRMHLDIQDAAPVDDEQEYEGNDLPAMAPVTAGVIHLPHKESLVVSPDVTANTAPPELTLDNAYANRHALPQIKKSKKRRAVDLRMGRGLVAPRKDVAKIRTSTYVGAAERPNVQAIGQMRTVALRKQVRALIKEMSTKSKINAFIKILRMGSRIEYAMPELFYKGDPCRAMLFVESIDLAKFAIAIGESNEQNNRRSEAQRANRPAGLGKAAAAALFV